MKQVATFDHAGFGAEVKSRLAESGLSQERFAAMHGWANTALVSRAVNGKPLSQPNFLAFCRTLGIDPMAHFSVKSQTLTPPVSRETRRIGSIADIRKSFEGAK